MASLNLDDIQVASFETTAPSAGTDTLVFDPQQAIDTQQLACMSPFCAYSEQRTCPERCP